MTEFLAVSEADLRTCCKFQLSDQKVKLLERVVYSIYIDKKIVNSTVEHTSWCDLLI